LQTVAVNGYRRRLEEALALLPTPTAGDAKGTRNRTAGRSDPDSGHHDGVTLNDAVNLLPTPRATRGGSNTETARLLLPTPEASDATGGRMSKELGGTRPSGSKRAVTLGTAVDHLLPTPTSSDHKGRNQRGDDTCLPGAVDALLPTPTARLADERGPQAKRYVNPDRSYDLDDAIQWIGAGSSLPSDGGKRSPAIPPPRQLSLETDG
jgi:hypothetical protein